jgi:hypothetical protein
LFFVGALGLVVAAPAASAGATTTYAYAAGRAVSPTSCPQTAATSQQCTLATAVSLAKAGGTVALATPGKTGHYVGNWSIATSGTSSSAPLTIKPVPGVIKPVLDGNHGKPAGCQTKACNGPVLTIGSGVHLDIYGLTVQDADNTLSPFGGAVQNNGGTLSVSACTFSRDTAKDGGAIGNAGLVATGTVTVSGSTFTANTATGSAGGVYDGGAIDNNGTGTLAVSGSTFSANTAKDGGGTINNFNSVWAAADIFNGGCHEAAGATWKDEGYNVGADAACLSAGTGDASHGAGHLGPLAHNGGPTETMLALAANPALGAVPLNTTVKLNGRSVTLCPTIDQRGVHSAAGKACNAGAVQSAEP